MTGFQFRIHEATGGVCCAATNSRSEQIPSKHPCPKCVKHYASQGLRAPEGRFAVADGDYPPPDIYAKGLAALRAASTPPVTTFEQQYKAERLAALEATRRGLDAAGPPPCLTAAEEAARATYAPPNGYSIAIDKMKERR